MDLNAIPILDHHCHALRRAEAPTAPDSFRRCFAEATDPAMAAHTRTSIFYLRAIRDLAALLGCAPEEAAVLAARDAAGFEEHARRLFAAGNFRRLLVDTGFGGAATVSVAEMAALAGCPAATVLRLETQMERLIAANDRLDAVEEQLRATVRAARENGIIGLKSIAAYRGGLHVGNPTRAEAEGVFPALRETARREGRLRLSDRTMLDYLLRAAMEEAAALELPLQFHVAFGDDDADLRAANPLHLRPLLRDDAFRRVPFVLLHCYPYVREAGYLASIYPNVYVDLSLTVPLTAHGSATAFAEALELAPVSKVLFATDAHTIPELFFLGALHGRHGLGQTLERLTSDGIISARQAESAAEDILWRNAARLYATDAAPAAA